MKTTLISALFISTLLFSTALAAANDGNQLEKRLERLESRIDSLERTVESLQNRLMDAEYGNSRGSGRVQAQQQPAGDLLIGVWECTNKVFTYEITFFADGRLVQEEPFFGKARVSNWSRLSDNRFIVAQPDLGNRGLTFSGDFESENNLTITNFDNQVPWECTRLE